MTLSILIDYAAIQTELQMATIIRCYRETLTEMDLQTSLAEAQLAVDYFFNNKFAEAKQLMEPW